MGGVESVKVCVCLEKLRLGPMRGWGFGSLRFYVPQCN